MNGYVVIDCKGLNLLSQVSQTIKGLYKRCIEADFTDKIIIATNCQYGEGVEMSPIPVFCIVENGVYIFTSSILQIRVSSNDSVVITSLLT